MPLFQATAHGGGCGVGGGCSRWGDEALQAAGKSWAPKDLLEGRGPPSFISTPPGPSVSSHTTGAQYMCVVEMRAILRFVTAICPGLLAQAETPLGPEVVVSTPSPPPYLLDQAAVLGQGTPSLGLVP